MIEIAVTNSIHYFIITTTIEGIKLFTQVSFPLENKGIISDFTEVKYATTTKPAYKGIVNIIFNTSFMN